MTGTPEAVVVGGGLAGVAAAVAVARSGLRTLHLAPKGPPDRRTSALMGPSVDYLTRTGLIADPARLGHPLTEIRIIDATDRLIRAPETLFRADEAGLAAFGWNFANTLLLEAFEAARGTLDNLETRDLALKSIEPDDAGWRLVLADDSTIIVPLVVGSDGKKSLVRVATDFRAREHGFTQAALVCDLELARPLGGTSVEFHYEQGPFTLVPAGGSRANLVWIDDRETLKAAQASGAEGLRRTFLEKSQRLFGDIKLLTPAHMFLLSTLTVDKAGMNGVLLAGEAAHAFPPIGAQGLNLGLRDVADLQAALAGSDRSQLDWAKAVSDDYAGRRADDLQRTGAMVDALFRSLLSDFLPAQALRAGGLWALRMLPPLRRTAFGLGMGNR
jgi:2-octaprenyl-6-methoxyphenol hydroxylase